MLTMLKCKIHRATVTDADLDYEGSISICPELIQEAGLHHFEQVDIYNITNGERFTTYVIPADKAGEIAINGAAAHKATTGDLVIICSYLQVPANQAAQHQPTVVLVDDNNQPKAKGNVIPLEAAT